MDTERPDNEAAEAADEDRPRRRRSPVAVASVAAAVLLVGGGGAYFAATATGGSGGKGSGTPRGEATPPLLTLDGYTQSGTGNGTAGSGGTDGIAPGEPDPNGVTYRAEGELPDGPSSAAVYRTKGTVTAAEVAKLAEALGVEGTPKAEGDAWKVGATKDGFGAGLRVSKQAPGAWTFSRFAPGSDNCKGTTTCAGRSGTAGGSRSESAKGADVDPVSAAAAKKAAAPVLKAVGQDDAKLDAGQLMDAVRVVNAEPEVGGLPTYGWTTGVQIGPDGQVVGGSGQVKAPAKTDTYPVISAEKTLGLLNGSGTGDGRVGIGGCASPVPLKDRDEKPCEASGTAPKSDPVVVEDAVFGLAAHFVDGRQALVPSWLFEVRPPGTDDSFTVTHPAVDPKYLTSPKPPEAEPSGSPTGPPSPRTSEPGGGTSTGPGTRDVRVEGYSADGEELTVRFTGGVCSDYSASAGESGGEVTVKVTDKPDKDKVCIMIAKVFHEKIDLGKPLGDRKVVGSDGKAVPQEKDLPDRTG
ncbi:hypothetical protein J8N05_15595 [Streptomyces sp. BH-SS-21]|uniref:Large membrane protein n=1 Tax=Streptomyces liliiviolaceus TaxID=2823109 RepID=A0A941B6R1_9ACTN|nr:hypothetical protein [Streptomyces liliiviolaceus]MBQ0849626.1 hypothetical protein [Streptomyces liliiviolaceus]